ncbi:unnamed protein product [Brassica rapa subsp. trilocularis]
MPTDNFFFFISFTKKIFISFSLQRYALKAHEGLILKRS